MKRTFALALLAGMLLTGCLTSDKENPTVTVVFPSSGSTVSRGNIAIKAVATDNKGVVKVEFYVNGSLQGTDNIGGAGDTFRYTWSDTVSQVPGQSYSLVAKAWDKAENSAASATVTITIAGGGGGTGPTYHDDNIVGGDSIWYPSGNPHIVTRDIAIHENGRLTIMPGCVVKFADGAGIHVGGATTGTLVAEGKPDSLITFTSNSSSPAPGAWFGFWLSSNTSSGSRFSYCDIEYAGQRDEGAIDLSWGATVGINNCIIRRSAGHGIAAEDQYGNATGLNSNTITDCAQHPLFLTLNNAGTIGTGNVLKPNTGHGILVDGGQFTESVTWANHGVPYVLLGTEYKVWHDNAPVLTVAAGCTVKMRTGASISVGNTWPGGLVADDVMFTSAASAPQRGDWDCIWFGFASRDADCRLTNCRIEYGGEQGYGNIGVEDALPTITGCHFAHSSAYGIYLSGEEHPDPDLLRANNTFEDNAAGDIYEP